MACRSAMENQISTMFIRMRAWGEVDVHPRVRREPLLDRRVFVRAVVVQHQVGSTSG